MQHTGHAPGQGGTVPATRPAAGPGTTGDLVLGLDVGAASTRVLLCDLGGTRYGYGTGAGGSPAARRPAAALSVALRGALAGADPRGVSYGVVGLAGRRLGHPDVRAALRRTWREAGLRCPLTVVPDTATAFAAGTAVGSGSVLIAGAGANAARMDRWEEVHRADGLGWLLGDLGSGFWMGREAVRATLDALAGRVHAPVLGPLVLHRMLGAASGLRPAGTNDGLTDRLVAAVHAQEPVALAQLAPLVTAAAERDDEVARGIVASAAGHLLTTLAAVRTPGEQSPVVLAGSYLVTDNALAHEVVREIGRHWAGAAVSCALDGSAGAAVLAADSLGMDEVALASMHRRLTGRRG